MGQNVLVGCINELETEGIRTRFFFVYGEEEVRVRDVTKELCEAIEVLNELATKLIAKRQQHCLKIPYEYESGLAVYSFGCGLSHYLQQDNLEKLSTINMDTLSFPLKECHLEMLTPRDLSHFYGITDVFQEGIKKALIGRYSK